MQMKAVTEFLFPAPAKRTVGSIIGWWEKRRLPYNLMVGTAGVFSLAWPMLLAALPPIGATPFFPWQGILAFGLLANACYLLGPATEILIEKIWGREVLPTGPVLYRMGLTFSVGLALLPTLIVTIIWVAQVVFAIF